MTPAGLEHLIIGRRPFAGACGTALVRAHVLLVDTKLHLNSSNNNSGRWVHHYVVLFICYFVQVSTSMFHSLNPPGYQVAPDTDSSRATGFRCAPLHQANPPSPSPFAPFAASVLAFLPA